MGLPGEDMGHGRPVTAIGARLRQWAGALRPLGPARPEPAAGPIRVTSPAASERARSTDAVEPVAPEVLAEPALRQGTAVTACEETAAAGPGAPICYVYGIVAACTRLPSGLAGAGGGAVRLVPYGALAGVVSEVPPGGAQGTGQDLLAHENVVASLAARTTMLPLRFSAVVTTPEGLVEEMLEPCYDWFTGILTDLEGRAQFSVSGTYVQDTVLREVLAEDPEVMRLRESLRGLPEDAGYGERIRLGELIVHALGAKREIDTRELIHTLSRYAVAVAPRSPVDEDTAADAAFLVGEDDRAGFCQAVDELSYRWAGRIRLRVLGPRAPYDFVPAPPGGTSG